MIKPKKSVQKTKGYSYPTPFKEIVRNYNLDINKILKLDYNEPTIGPSKKVKNALINFIKFENIEWYPGGDCKELREKISKYCNIKLDKIIVSNGSDEILKTIAFTYLNEGDKVLTQSPEYSMFLINSLLCGAKIIEINCDNNLKFNFKRLLNSINENIKIIYLSNPNTPIGLSYNNQQIRRLLNKAKNSLVIIDEAYFEFNQETCASYLNEFENLIVVRTFSKAYGIASLRLGYALANEKIIFELNKVKDPESVNSLAQIAAIEALNDIKYKEKIIKNINKNKIYLKKELTKLEIFIPDSKANFLFLKFPKKYDAKKLFNNLEIEGIFLRDRTKIIENCIRISVPYLKKDCERIIKEIKKELNPILIFDIDGVLIDTSKSYNKTIKETVKKITGKEISSEDIIKIKEQGGFNCDWETSLKLVNNLGISIDRKKLINIFQKFYLGNNKKEGFRNREKWLFDKKLLKKLSDEYKLNIFTGRPKGEAIYSLKKEKVINFFDEIICREDVTKGKPNPEGLIKIKNKTNNCFDKGYYFGDLGDDIKAAKLSGLIAIGVITPEKNNYNFLKKENADFIISSINNIVEVIKNENR